MATKADEEITAEEPVEANGTEEVAEDDPEVVEAAVTPAPAPAPAPARRAPGTKEPIQFRWKLVGDSAGVALTLFKSVEREEVEAQFARVQREGYYTNLRILDIDEPVKQPTRKGGSKKKAAKQPTPKRSAKATPKPTRSKATRSAGGSVVLVRAKTKRATAATKKTKTATKKRTTKSRSSTKSSRKKTPAKRTSKKTTKSAATKKRTTKSKKKKR